MSRCVQCFLGQNVTLRAEIDAIANWPLFLRLLHRHRLVAIAHQTLQQTNQLQYLPPAQQQQLHRHRQRVTQQNLKLTAATLSLLDQFARAQIRALPLKGPLLSIQLYQSQTLRQSSDIDLLIEPHAYAVVKSLLQDLGYRYEQAACATWSPRLEQAYLQQQGEIAWYHPVAKLRLDLHLRWSRHPLALPLTFEQAWQQAATLRVAASSPQVQPVKILCPDHQILYLSVHGAKHQWERLLWLTDLAGCMPLVCPSNWGLLLDQACQLGIERSIGQALILIETVLGMTIPTEWQTLCCSQPVQALTQTAVARFAHAQPAPPPGTLTTPPLSPQTLVADLRYEIALQTKWRYQLHCLTRPLFTAKDWQVLPLPSYLWGLYIPLRPFLYGYRWLRQQLKPQSLNPQTLQPDQQPD